MADPVENPGPPNAAAQARINALQRHVEEMERTLVALRDVQRSMRVQSILAVLALVVIMLGFGWATYAKVKDNLAEEKLRDALQARSLPLVEHVADQALLALREAAPVYRELAVQRLDVAGPEIRAQAAEELRKLPVDIQAQIVASLEAVAETTAKRLQNDLKATMPYLTDERAEDILQQFVDALNREMDAYVARVQKLVDAEGQRFADALLKFRVPAVDAVEKVELEKQLVSRLLALLDYEIQVAGTEEGISLDPVQP